MSAENFIQLCLDGNVEDVQNYLVEYEEQGRDPLIDFSGRDSLTKTVLDNMAMIGKSDMLKLLAEKGFDVNSTSGKGYTPLHHAACWGQLSCLKVLYLAGADLGIVNVNQETAKDCAIRYGHAASKSFLDIAEAQTELRDRAKSFKDILADPEKNMGRFSKEERHTGNRICDEKIAWVELTKETASLTQIKQMKSELLETMNPILAKLEDTYNEPPKGARSYSKSSSKGATHN